MRQAVRERGKNERVRAVFWDDELVSPDTVAYVDRVRALPDVDMQWLCVPQLHQFAFAFGESGCGWWSAWDEAERDRWVRPMPEWGIPDPPWRLPDPIPIRDYTEFEAAHHLPAPTVNVLGIRAEESPSRRMSIARNGFLIRAAKQATGRTPYAQRAAGRIADKAYPIWDWPQTAIWQAIAQHGWDWSREYMRRWQAGQSWREVRVSQPVGEEASIQTLFIPRAYPDYWQAICRRFPDAVNIVRYAHGALLGRGRVQGTATADDIVAALSEMSPDRRSMTASSIMVGARAAVRFGSKGMRSADYLKIALRGDSKADRLRIKLQREAALRAFDSGRYYRPWMKQDQAAMLRIAINRERTRKQTAAAKGARARKAPSR